MFEESVSIWASMNSWFTTAVLFVLLNVMIGIIAIASNLGTNQKHQDPQNQQQGLARSPSVLQRIKSINFYHYRSPELHNNTFEKKPETTETTHYAFRHTQEPEQPQFTRSPSLLERLKSINRFIPQDFSTNPSQPITTTTTLHKTQEPESHFEQGPEYDQFQDDDHFEGHEHPESPEPEEEEHPESPEPEEVEEEEEEEEEEKSLDEIYSQLKPLQDHHVSRSKSDTKPASGEVPTKLPKKMKKSASSKSTFGHFKEEDIVEIRRPATVRERKAKVTEDEEVDAKADDFINKFKNQLKLQRLDSIIRYKDMLNRGT